MKKNLFFVAAASALLLTACSSESEVAQSAPQQSGPMAIAFDDYVPDVTRAGKTGAMTTTTLKAEFASGGGFGVFATYSDDGDYVATKGPNFMYNQKVTWDGTAMGWKYEPLKYWPNETQDDSQTNPATMGSRVDKLSFFAYAPYVAHSNAATGQLSGVTYSTPPTPDTNQTGIIKVTTNDITIADPAPTDPKVMYRVTANPAQTVDLLWGVAPAGDFSYSTVSSTTPTVTVDEGKPLKNLIKPSKDQKMKFLFKHALSRINFSVVGAFDQIAPGGKQDANTKVLVEKVQVFGASDGTIKTDGWLNLNNTAAGVALWEDRTGGDYTSTALFTVEGAAINSTIKDGGAVAFGSQVAGVTTSEKNLFEDATNFFAVIPNDPNDATETTDFIIEITYYIQTKDDALEVSGSVDGTRVKNIVRVPVSVWLQNNKSYNFRLVLGLTSVKLDAEVAEWELAGDVDANLPQNK